ncbi:beta-ketoacyl synthase N-terminal-like domain-containing protein [Streptomyces sp. NPDC018693]|uniref:type I polyketide synthase n=1 Tax=unclassified Streptomyces TaxID=2593676 RepID=UPI0037978FB3
MAVLLPGAADLDAYWRNLCDGVDAIDDVPQGRWDADYYRPGAAGEAAVADRVYCRRGGFVDGLAEVEVTRFGIMPASVAGTEPDQLIALHVAAAALADAGGPDRLPDRRRIGVVLGRGGYLTPGLVRLDQRVRTAGQLVRTLGELVPGLTDDQLAGVKRAFTERLGPDSPESAIGLVPNLAASRVANRLDLRGPAYTVDAACASSLVAVDQAVGELATGRCDVMLAGGVHHCHDITLWSVFSQLRALSPSQRIRPFHRDADGILVGEGTGVVVLKRLADAERDGDRVYAVIRGTGVASDGRAAGLVNPDPGGQALAVRQAWEAAGLDPAEPGSIGLLEAHGTATPAGDTAELTTLAEVFGTGDGQRAVIGSVKSMIGHTMPAAGVAGLVKAALAVHHRTLLPTLHCDDPHPALARTRFRALAEAAPWETSDAQPVRRAAVNAFGFGGINAHVVLEEAPGAVGAAGGPVRVAEPERVLLLAADTVEGLAGLLDADDGVVRATGLDPARPHLAAGRVRLGIVEPTAKRLALARRAVGKGRAWQGRSDVWFRPGPLLGGAGAGRLAFVFPGLEGDFAPRVDDVAAHFGLARPAVAEEGVGDVGRHGFGVVAVGRLLDTALRRAGIVPDAVAGHSVGEWTAMVSGGMYDGDEVDAFMADFDPDSVSVPGLAFGAIGAPAERVLTALRDDGWAEAGLVLSHDNAPGQSMVCGPDTAVDGFVRAFRARGVLSQVLPFRSGFHTPMLEPHLGPIREAAARFRLRPPAVPVWSGTTAAPFPSDEADIRALFLRHLLEPVRFRQLTEALYAAGHRAYVQVGPGRLGSLIDDTLGDRDHLVVPANSPHRDGLAQLRRVATALWTAGAGVAPSLPAGTGAGATGRPAGATAQLAEAPSRPAEAPSPRTGAPSPPAGTSSLPRVASAADGGRAGAVRAPVRLNLDGALVSLPPETLAELRAEVGAGLAAPAGAPTAGPGTRATQPTTPAADPATRPTTGNTHRTTTRGTLATQPTTPPDVPTNGPTTSTTQPTTPAADPATRPTTSTSQPTAPADTASMPTAGTVQPTAPSEGRAAVGGAAALSSGRSPLDALAARFPVAAELDALLRDTAETAAALMSAARSAGAAQGTAPRPPAALAPTTHATGMRAPTTPPPARPGTAPQAPATPTSAAQGTAAQGTAPRLPATPAPAAQVTGMRAPATPPPVAQGAVGRAGAVSASLAAASSDSGAQGLVAAAWHGTVRVSPETMPYLLDHCFFPQRPGWPDVADRWPVVPATTIVRHIMDAAGRAAPGRLPVGVHGARFEEWLTATPAVDVPVAVTPEGGDRLAVSFGPRARATVELADRYPAPPPAPWRTDPASERTPDHTAAQLYSERWMFHGPAFQGVSELTAIGERHIRGVITTPPAPGALLDNVGQILGYWIMATRSERTVVFPVGMREMRFHGPHPAPGTDVECLVRITSLTDAVLEADVQLTVAGEVWAELYGWQDRRFDNDPTTRPVERFPDRNTLSEPRPGGWTLLHERWPDLASRELIMRNSLGEEERSEYAQHAPRGRRQWLLGRIAVKDAVRRWLWDHGEGPVFPAELRVRNDAAGRPYVVGVHGRRLPPLDVSLAHRAEAGVAIVRPHTPGPGPGIDIEEVTDRDPQTVATALGPQEIRLLHRLCAASGEPQALWFTRFWAAKEAVAKAEGTGFGGRPRDFAVLDAAPAGELLTVSGRLARAYPVRCAPAANPPRLPHREYVVAWTTGAEQEEEHDR